MVNDDLRRESVGGEDFLTASLWCKFEPVSRWDAMTAVLYHGKEAAKEDPEGDARIIKIKKEKIEVEPTGAKNGGLRTDFRFKWGGITFMLRRERDAQSPMPNLQIAAGSTLLMTMGIEAVWQRVLDFVGGEMCGQVHRNTVSRVDMAVDLPDVPVSALASPLLCQQYVSRLPADEFYRKHGKVTGWKIGGGRDVLLRVYDKALELRTRVDPEKAAAVRKWRWGGKECTEALRVEWQIRGNWLRSIRLQGNEVRSVEEWIDQRGNVLRYLNSKTFRVVEGWQRGDDNSNRAQTHPTWTHIRELFQEASGPCVPFAVNRHTPKDAASRRLMAQARGCLMKCVAQSRKRVRSIFELHEECSRLILNALQDLGQEAVLKRMAAYEMRIANSSGVAVEPWEEFMEYGDENFSGTDE